MPTESTLLHVFPGRLGAWFVVETDTGKPLAEHDDASAALRDATARARTRGGGEVLLHDRYHHVHLYRCAGRR
jgi:hypothetical protein